MGIATNVNGHLPMSLLDPARPGWYRVRKVTRVFDLEHRIDSGLSTLRNRGHQKGRSFPVRGGRKSLRLRLFVRSSRVVRGCLMMMLDGRMGCLGSHEKFHLKVDKRYDFVPKLVELLLSVPPASLAPQHLRY